MNKATTAPAAKEKKYTFTITPKPRGSQRTEAHDHGHQRASKGF